MRRGPTDATVPEPAGRSPSTGGRGPRVARWLLGGAKRWLCLRRFLILLLACVLLTFGYGWLAEYQAWRAALRHQGFVDAMSPPAAGDRVMVFAPHPDDEALGCGGVIQEALRNGAQVDVVLLTNGDASELSLIFGEKEVLVSPKAMIRLGASRQEESILALGRLGLPASRVHFLSYPNNGLTQLWQPAHWLYRNRYVSRFTHSSLSPYPRSTTPQAPYCGQQVLADTIQLLQQRQPNKVFLPHPKDVHPDHWATACFVEYALATIAARGGAWAAEAERYGYLVHWPRFPAPARVSLKTDLLPPADLTGEDARWLRLDLPRSAVRRKFEAIRCYTSQLPQFDRFLLKFARANETFERLLPQTVVLGRQALWQDRGGRRHSLGGADLEALKIALKMDGRASASFVNGGRRLRKKSYLALDLRGWDSRGAPIVVEVQVKPGGEARATRVSGSAVTSGAVACQQYDRGISVGFRVPRELLSHRGLFLSCWGSVKDRTVDSAVVAQLDPLPE